MIPPLSDGTREAVTTSHQTWLPSRHHEYDLADLTFDCITNIVSVQFLQPTIQVFLNKSGG